MLNISWPMNAEQVVSRGVPACWDSVTVYRDRQPVNGAVADAISPVIFTHFTVNPLVPRPRAKHG